MKRNEQYRQCRLVKRLREGQSVQMSYIPDEFAREGRVVKLRDEAGDWDDGWVIALVRPGSPSECARRHELAHRRFSGESAKA